MPRVSAFGLPLVCLLAACSWEPPLPEGPQPVTATILYRAPHWGLFEDTLFGNHLVVTSREAVGGTISKLDVLTGQWLWHRDDLLESAANPVKIGGHYYYPVGQGESANGHAQIVEVSEDGQQTRLFDLGSKAYYIYDYSFYARGDSLYYGTLNLSGGEIEELPKYFIEVTPAQALWDEAQGFWSLTPRILFTAPHNDGRERALNGCYFWGDDLILPYHTVSFPDDYTREERSWIYRINLATLETTVLKEEWTGRMFLTRYGKDYHFGDAVALPNGGSFLVINKTTGATIWDEFHHATTGVHLGEDGFIYITTYAVAGGDAIVKIDPHTWTVVWISDPVPYTTSMDAILRNGVLYWAAPDKLYLFDASTGKILGYDPAAKGQLEPTNNVNVYGDILIINDAQKYTGVRMDFRIENGRLVR